MRVLYLALLPSLLAGCANVHIHNIGDATTVRHRQFGLISLTLSPGHTGATLVQTSGFGAVRTPTGASIGFWKETLALLGNESDCRAVIWVEDSSQIAEIQRILREAGRSLNNLCIVDGGVK